MIKLAIAPMLAALVATGAASGESYTEPGIAAPIVYEEVLVTGGRDAIRTLAGSATFIDEETISKFDRADLNELLGQVPGVYIRFEDGYGLRPNIGIRGATSERSQKITLMEDGMLIAPAPYSAPAAYYIPNVNRMAAVEVFKGPAAIEYGPHTVGGALNLVTPNIPAKAGGEIDAAFGNNEFRKGRFVYGGRNEQFGFRLDALFFGADGFKELDSGGSTGFDRSDVNLRAQWRSDPSSAFPQQLDLKLGYADEDSDETYLGLTDSDFDDNPVRRYVASDHDHFQSRHEQAHLLHNIEFGGGLNLFTTVYMNRFDRSWNKFDGFIDGPSPSLVLAYPDIFLSEIALLRGEAVSDVTNESTIIDVTNNDRQYGSQGLETRLGYVVDLGEVEHDIKVGLRYHHDYVDRDHKVRGLLMTEVGLASDGLGERYKKALNHAETTAWSAFIRDQLSFGKWNVNLGLRYEDIDGHFDDELNSTNTRTTTSVLLPGVGVFYQYNDWFGLLAGVNKGFSPAGPSAGEGVNPEQSVNYEYGVRITRDALRADLIGFFSDYSNLLGRCRASDSGCDVGQEFNGGKVEIAGAEFTLNYVADWFERVSFPIDLTYTYTESAFQNSFQSGFPQWGLVRAGDELPYIPEHQGRMQVGVAGYRWSVDLAVKYIGQMREMPGQDSYGPGRSTRSLTTIGLAGSYAFTSNLTLRLIGENLTDQQEIVSRRPFGARPNTPRTIRVGFNYRF